MSRGWNRIDGTEKAFRRLMGTVRRAAKAMQTYSVVLAGIAVYSAIKAFADFEKAMYEVQAVSQGTAMQLDALSEKAQQLGATTKFTATEAAEGIAYLSMAGLSAKESLLAIEASLDLAAAGTLDLGLAADLATNVMAAFNKQADEMTHIADVLAHQAASANTTVEQLGTAISFVGPVAAASNISLERTVATVGALSDRGIRAERAGTSLRGVISALQAPAGKAADLLERLGVETHDALGEMRDVLDILKDLRAVGMNAADAVTLFGRRQAPAALIIAENVKAIEKQAAALEKVEGAAKLMATTKMSGLTGALYELKSAWEAVNITALLNQTLLEDLTDHLTTKLREIRIALEWLEQHREFNRKGYVGPALTLEYPEGYTDSDIEREKRQRLQAEAEQKRREVEAAIRQAELDAELAKQREEAARKAEEERMKTWQVVFDVTRATYRYSQEQLSMMVEDAREALGVIEQIRKASQAISDAQLQAMVAEGQRGLEQRERVKFARVSGRRDLESAVADADNPVETVERVIADTKRKIEVTSELLRNSLQDSTKQSLRDQLEIMRGMLEGQQMVSAEIATRVQSRMEVFVETARRGFDNISDAIGRTIIMTDSWEQALRRITRLVAFRFLESFISSEGLGRIIGGAAKRTVPVERAIGGPMYAGTVYKVHQDEVIVPRTDATVIPAHRAAGGDVSITVPITVIGEPDTATVAAMEVTAQRVARGVYDDMRVRRALRGRAD